jgi:ABC-type phosphate transport system ATPase subunit
MGGNWGNEGLEVDEFVEICKIRSPLPMLFCQETTFMMWIYKRLTYVVQQKKSIWKGPHINTVIISY